MATPVAETPILATILKSECRSNLTTESTEFDFVVSLTKPFSDAVNEE